MKRRAQIDETYGEDEPKPVLTQITCHEPEYAAPILLVDEHGRPLSSREKVKFGFHG